MRKIVQRGLVVLLGVIIGGLLLLNEAVYAFEGTECEWGNAVTGADEDNKIGNVDDSTGLPGTLKNEIAEEGMLPIKIARDDGVEIMPKDKEIINTNKMLRFSTDMGVRKDLFIYKKGDEKEIPDVDGLLSEKTELQYSVSFDMGATFGDWQSSDHGTVCISPAADLRNGL